MPDSNTIRNIRARLERWELTHLRELAATLHDQLEAAEARANEAERWASSLDHQVQMLHDELRQLCEESGAQLGLTKQGDVVVLKPESGPAAAPSENGHQIHKTLAVARSSISKAITGGAA